MVKFSHGCWHPAPDTLIDWAVETVVAETRGDKLHFVTVSFCQVCRGWVILGIN
jgi:alpha-D-xyloside xylohydrolase